MSKLPIVEISIPGEPMNPNFCVKLDGHEIPGITDIAIFSGMDHQAKIVLTILADKIIGIQE